METKIFFLYDNKMETKTYGVALPLSVSQRIMYKGDHYVVSGVTLDADKDFIYVGTEKIRTDEVAEEGTNDY